MMRALELAKNGMGKTSPNPMVGAVLVKNGKIIAETWHMAAGKKHAEIKVLQSVSSENIKGATLYVTLEPCCHYGKTPPCADFLLKKGLKRIVVAMRDPNPLINGKSIKILRKAGITVNVGILKKEAERLNEAFARFITSEYPFVVAKIAATLDSKIASVSGDSRWITNEQSRKMVHRMRARVDAIITSGKTVMIDDPHLGACVPRGRDPLRVIIDSALTTHLNSQVYRDKNVLVATSDYSSPSQKKAFEKAKIPLVFFKGRRVPLKALLRYLRGQNIASVMIEAGAGLTSAFLQQKLVDKIHYFIAPKILGEGLPALSNLGIKKIRNAITLKKVSIECFGDNVMFTGYMK